MYACPTCGFKNREGTLFCEACGSYFHTGGALATNALPEESTSRPGPSGLRLPDARVVGAEASLILANEEDHKHFVIDAHRTTMLLGRNDRKSRLVVDIDLSGEEGQAYGVSRRHARVHFLNGRFLLEDLESLNGTYLNERRLRPYLPEVLHDGDQVKLGNLALSVSIEEKSHTPAES